MQIGIWNNLRLGNKRRKKELSRTGKQIRVYVFVPEDYTYDYGSPVLTVR